MIRLRYFSWHSAISPHPHHVSSDYLHVLSSLAFSSKSIQFANSLLYRSDLIRTPMISLRSAPNKFYFKPPSPDRLCYTTVVSLTSLLPISTACLRSICNTLSRQPWYHHPFHLSNLASVILLWQLSPQSTPGSPWQSILPVLPCAQIRIYKRTVALSSSTTNLHVSLLYPSQSFFVT